MLEKYFQLGPLPANILVGQYDWHLVVLSCVVAVFASFIALDITERLRDRNTSHLSSMMWLIGGSIAMGSGIWSMHFVGMLSFTIPSVTLQYGFFWTSISLIVAILASGFALYLLKRSVLNAVHIIAGGLILGLAIASMHYTGMAAMFISLDIRYLPVMFILSILVAIIASLAAILLSIQTNRTIQKFKNRIKTASAFIMGIAICGMHYLAMGASIFTPLCTPTLVTDQGLDPSLLSVAVASVTVVMLLIAFFASSTKESLNQQQYERARKLGMAEISTSVLHNVGNVLNSVNVSVDKVTTTFGTSLMAGIVNIAQLLNEHKDDLGEFISKDNKGVHVLDYLNQLADTYKKEKEELSAELAGLKKNLVLIKDIISTQQDFSKTMELRQMLSINALIDEALLISGINLIKEIKVVKKYARIAPYLFDKVKLLQVLVNLIQNSKQALQEGKSSEKILTLKTIQLNKKTLLIEISDNGVGISPENMNKIFNFGFTTKQTGHGFGLHASALAVNHLGGKISVESNGINQGAKFIIQLPLYTS